MFGDERLPARFWSKVSPSPDGCWRWTARIRPDGYGEMSVASGSRLAHRIAYVALMGTPETDTLDHLCRNRWCVNPAHLEPVTRRENVLRGVALPAVRARQTHCKYGHPLSGDNLHLQPRGNSVQRYCITCRRRNRMKAYARNRDAEKLKMKDYYQSNKEKWE
jgi:hypothetical protein